LGVEEEEGRSEGAGSAEVVVGMTGFGRSAECLLFGSFRFGAQLFWRCDKKKLFWHFLELVLQVFTFCMTVTRML